MAALKANPVAYDVFGASDWSMALSAALTISSDHCDHEAGHAERRGVVAAVGELPPPHDEALRFYSPRKTQYDCRAARGTTRFWLAASTPQLWF
jgi:hypothetical protein